MLLHYVLCWHAMCAYYYVSRRQEGSDFKSAVSRFHLMLAYVIAYTVIKMSCSGVTGPFMIDARAQVQLALN